MRGKKMERDEVAVGGVGGGVGGKSAESFIDRSKVRILLCENDPNSSQEVFTLLCKCSYQVTAVKSARQVIDALNAEGPDIDIILSEVDLPMAKGMKLLKYIMRDKELRRIPVIMMSAQDEVSVVVKCLRLGAADYLVKPLRTNELLNLWTHMWRRRRMLGLAEKNITNYDIDLVASDPSDANTNSATLFSDDTDEKSRKSAIQENFISMDDQEDEINEVQRQVMSIAGTTAAPVGRPPMAWLDNQPDVPGISDRRTGQFVSCPKKSELRIGESSSAFFTYVKSSAPRVNTQEANPSDDNETRNTTIDNPPYIRAGQAGLDSQGSANRQAKQVDSDTQCFEKRQSNDNHSQGDVFLRSNSIPDSFSIERSVTPPTMMESQQQSNSNMEEFSRLQMHPSNVSHHQDISGFHRHPGYPYFVPGMMNQVMMSQGQMFQKPQDLPNHVPPSMFPQFGHLPHVPGMAPFPYYPVNMCMQQGGGQMPPTQPWPPSYGSPSQPPEGQIGKIDRRVAALMKFRQKRKERCFDKKIRYVNRKKLAERRPRVRGQFVRKMNGINVDLNGDPASGDFEDDEEEEDDEEVAARDDYPDYDASLGL